MKKTETFPLYHLEEKTPASIQFELMKMPDFSLKTATIPSSRTYMAFTRLYGFRKVQESTMLILRSIR